MIVERSGFAVPEPAAPPPKTASSPAQAAGHAGDSASATPLPAPPVLEPVPVIAPPRRDPQLSRAGLEDKPLIETRAQAPRGAQSTAPTPVAPPSATPPASGDVPEVDLPPIDGARDVEVPNLINPDDVPRAQALPGAAADEPAPPLRPAEPRPAPRAAAPLPSAPILPGSQRVTSIFPRSGRKVDIQFLPKQPDGTQVVIYRGGVNIVTKTPQFGIVDIEAESAVIWRHPDPKKGEEVRGPNGELIENANQPMEVYLEGNVILRQDENKVAGKGDQRTYPRGSGPITTSSPTGSWPSTARSDVFAPGFIAPMKLKSPRIEQFHKLLQRPDGTLIMDPNPEIRAEQSMMTGSRFPNPAYQINNRSVDLTRKARSLTDPNSGKVLGDPDDPDAPMDLIWQVRRAAELLLDGLASRLLLAAVDRRRRRSRPTAPPDRASARNNYFGQQVLTDWNGFKVFGLRRPDWIDNWNLDLDYLSARTKDFPALGSEMGWFGRDLIRDLTDPYHKVRTPGQNFTHDYFGYFDIWGLQGQRQRRAGLGPGGRHQRAPRRGQAGYQRSDVPPFQEIRGRFNIRHMQRFLPDDDEHQFEDLRLQLELAYVSDRHFLEEYYKRLNETGMDQETLAYMQYQKNNWSWTLWAEANLQNFYTDTQWLPRLDYYRLGDSLARTTGSPTTSTRAWTTPTPTPTSWSTTPTCSRSCRMTRSRTPAVCSRPCAATRTTRSTCR